MKKKNIQQTKNGFTLIELLAVIIILGILMIIAIPAVTKYIDESRKDSYITTAKTIIGGARNLVNSGELEFYDKDVTYYIPSSCIKTENSSESPYGDFSPAYVAVTYNGNSYDYYWISRDTSGIGIKYLTPLSELSTDYILSDIEKSEITPTVSVGGRSQIKVLNESNCKSIDDEEITDRINEQGERLVVIYPEGKERKDLSIGDVVKIINEEFYVIGYDEAKDELRLLAKYNLNVGRNPVPGAKVGIQNPKALSSSMQGLGAEGNHAIVNFSTTAYWVGNVGYGKKYPGSIGLNAYDTGLANIYDSNCIPYKYVEAYKKYFKDNRVKIKKAEIMQLEEAYKLTRAGYINIVHSTTSWLGTPSRACSEGCVYIARYWDTTNGSNSGYSGGIITASAGVRPVIVI